MIGKVLFGAVVVLGLLCSVAKGEEVVLDEDVDAGSGVIGAFLIGTRSFTPGVVVQEGNVTVEYVVTNVGDHAALDVELVDMTFQSSAFEVVDGGAIALTADEVKPGETIRKNVTLLVSVPGEYGDNAKDSLYKPKSAAVSYISEHNLENKLVLRLASTSTLVVEDVDAYRRRTDLHIIEWTVFLLVGALLAALPLSLSIAEQNKLIASQIKPKTKKIR
ncbi:Translocon-associated protein subunit beta [Porphyridium purpureum]|uniref:Translocon-associated protein subunit beta n=1 Tax=Porphyridium purpureum TaxID=35688 RepID=A0A5J4YNG8_PORPP|nr:Translocon-associated protein subunit beta [Porphyridium purpureum]|eukprot:POR1676..scf222_8